MIYETTVKKLKWVLRIASLLMLAIILKLVYLQIYSYSSLKDKAIELWQRSFPVEASRGDIMDVEGNVLATNLTTSSLVVIPSQIIDPLDYATKLAKILEVDVDTLYKKLSKKASIERISPEGRQLDDEKAKSIESLKLPGVYLIKDTLRYYPYNSYLSHCLGFVGIDNQGLVGLELKYDAYLKGKNGSINYYMDAKGHNLSLYASDYISPVSGFDIKLTIHKNVQDVVERELENAYLKYDPDGIWAIALDPKTGAILALASKPDYDPNHYQDVDQSVYNQNIPIWKTYEPGSTFKIVTFSSALNERLFDMDKDKYMDRGFEIVSGARIKSWKKGGHGLQTFREVLQNSSNPGFVEIGRRLGKERLYQYIQDFGLTSKTGVDLIGESKGIMFSYENFKELEQATVAFGQGISITPIQLVRAICACVNGGYLYEPYILSEVIDPMTNETIMKKEPTLIRQVIDEEVSIKVRDALESVVSDGGGKNAYIDGYRIGGKTGTAQKAVNGSYVNGGYILSFVGIAPVDDPQIVLYIAMDNAKNAVQYGGTTVAPIARNMLLDILPALKIKKVKEQKPKAYVWTDIPLVEVENYLGKTKKEIRSNGLVKLVYQGEGNLVLDQLPRPGEKIEQGKEVILYLADLESNIIELE